MLRGPGDGETLVEVGFGLEPGLGLRRDLVVRAAHRTDPSVVDLEPGDVGAEATANAPLVGRPVGRSPQPDERTHDSRMFDERRLDLGRFEANPVDLHLVVEATAVHGDAGSLDPHPVTGAVPRLPARPRRVDLACR